MNLKSCTVFALLVSLSGAASADASSLKHHVPHLLKTKKVVAEKKETLKLYPNPSTNGTVRVVSNMSGKLHFYIFDLEGTMLHQAVIAERGKHTVTNLKKGIYTYDAFYNDEGIEHGQLIVK